MSFEDDDESRIRRNGPGEANDGFSDSTSDNEEDDQDESVDGDYEGKIAEMHASAHTSPTNIQVENSSEVQVGPRILYNAPVTVNQHLHVAKPNDDPLQYALKAPLQDVDLNTNNIQGNYALKTQICKTEPRVHRLFSWKLVVIIMVLVVLLAISVALIIVLKPLPDSEEVKRHIYPDVPPVSPFNPNTTLPNGRRIYLKSDWYGEPPKFERQLQLPAPFVVISHTVTQPCYEFKTCAESMRTMQGVQVTDNDLPDLGYSFVVGNDGNVYEGRGWDVTNMHIGFVRRCNIGIALMGNFVHDEPTIGQINSTQELLELGVKLGKIAPDYKLIPHNATYATLSPGKNVVKIIEKWPHYWEPTRDDIGKCPYNV